MYELILTGRWLLRHSRQRLFQLINPFDERLLALGGERIAPVVCRLLKFLQRFLLIEQLLTFIVNPLIPRGQELILCIGRVLRTSERVFHLTQGLLALFQLITPDLQFVALFGKILLLLLYVGTLGV